LFKRGDYMELLSPAGNFDCLKAAVMAGADAVYIGGSHFSARRNAKNFTDDEIVAAAHFCHLNGAKLYVAVNILIKENELKQALSYAKFLIESGVDGIIVQDLGLLSSIRKMSDDIFINASTQMTIASSDAVNMAKKLGADRVVLARELALSDIKSIRKNTDTELEVFVHGALCMSWSGQCLISSVIGGRSGNRGLCAQPCRLDYTLLHDGKAVSKKIPLLSLKDICLADKLGELSGLCDSLKIEGRMKSSDYTASVTALYKKATLGKISQAEIDKTLSFFSRGGSGYGYLYERQFEKMMDYAPKEKIAAQKSDALNIKETSTKKPFGISFALVANEGEPLKLYAESCGFSAYSEGEILEPAKKEFDEERLKSQLEKLGDTPFFAENTKISYSNNPFVPVSSINSLRRTVCEELKDKICDSYKKEVHQIPDFVPKYKKRDIPKIVIEVNTKEQLKAAQSFGNYEILAGYELSKEENCDFVLCPAIKKEGEKADIKAPKIMAQNIGQLDFSKKVFGGERLNVTNSRTCELLKDLGVLRVTLSPELSAREIQEITKNTDCPTEVIAYGRLPVMVMENCVIKSCRKCSKSGGVFELSDRTGTRFPIMCENCRNILLNSVPIYMADKPSDLLSLNVDAIRLKFTTEDAQTVKKVISAYECALSGKPMSAPSRITRGHFYRGAE